MDENLHDTQLRQMEWVALDDIDRCAVIRVKKNSDLIKAETLLAMSKFLRQTTVSGYSARLKGVAQGMIRSCNLLGVFTKEEYECLLNILQNE